MWTWKSGQQMPSDKGRHIVRNSSSGSFSSAWVFFWSFSSPCGGVRASVQKIVKRRTYQQSHTRTAQLPEVSRIMRHSDFLDSPKIAASESNEMCFLRDRPDWTDSAETGHWNPALETWTCLSWDVFYFNIFQYLLPFPSHHSYYGWFSSHLLSGRWQQHTLKF